MQLDGFNLVIACKLLNLLGNLRLRRQRNSLMLQQRIKLPLYPPQSRLAAAVCCRSSGKDEDNPRDDGKVTEPKR